MINKIKAAFGRHAERYDSARLPVSMKEAFDRKCGSLPAHELRLLVAAMVD